MRKTQSILVSLLVVLLIVVIQIALGACSSSDGTFGQLSQEGQDVFLANCVICHGLGGTGGFAPSLDITLRYFYNNAEQLYDKIRFDMPRDRPRSLQGIQYKQVLSYILINNGYVGSQDAFDVGALSQIAITD
jgi:hypothetical protein